MRKVKVTCSYCGTVSLLDKEHKCASRQAAGESVFCDDTCMAKGLDKATLVTSCDTWQDAAWFAQYLTACQYPAENRGMAVYAVGLAPEQVESFWASFLGQGVRARLRNWQEEVDAATSKQLSIVFDLQDAQAAFLRLPSAGHYQEQERLSLKYQELFQSAEQGRIAIRSHFRDLEREVTARLARVEHDNQVGRMAQQVWARERAEREQQEQAG